MPRFGRQQFNRIGYAGGGAGQGHNAIRLRIKRDLLVRDAREKPDEPTREQYEPVAPAAMVRNPIQRANPPNMSVDHFKRVVYGMPRRQGGHPCNKCDLSEHGGVSDKANRE